MPTTIIRTSLLLALLCLALIPVAVLSSCAEVRPAETTLPEGWHPLPAATDVVRVSSGVPWPRGIVKRDGKLLVVARGVHRTAGGPNPNIQDHAGSIFEVDPQIFEPLVTGQAPSDAVKNNARLVAAGDMPPFRLWTRSVPATSDTLTDRPYAGLLYDAASENLFVLCYSGIDLNDPPYFRKNATDAIHRYDLRTKRWYAFESHNPATVPVEQLGLTIPNDSYPHHDVTKNPAPHGMVNGPCGGWVVGDFLYAVGKENSSLVQYDLSEIRKNPDAAPPSGRYIFRRSGPTDDPYIKVKGKGMMYVEGPGAVVTHGKWMYVAFRTTCQVVRFPITANGDVIQPIEAEYLAQFDPFETREDGSYTNTPDFFDMRTDPHGRCFLSCNRQGSIWEIPTDGKAFLDARQGTTAKPYINLRQITAHEKSTCGNFFIDTNGDFYICTGNKDIAEGLVRGTLYRVRATNP